MEKSYDELPPPSFKFKKLTLDKDTMEFYQQYKNLDRTKQENKFYKKQKVGFTTILNQSEKRRMLPSKLGLVGRKAEDTLDISNFHLGDNYISILGKAIKSVPEIK